MGISEVWNCNIHLQMLLLIFSFMLCPKRISSRMFSALILMRPKLLQPLWDSVPWQSASSSGPNLRKTLRSWHWLLKKKKKSWCFTQILDGIVICLQPWVVGSMHGVSGSSLPVTHCSSEGAGGEMSEIMECLITLVTPCARRACRPYMCSCKSGTYLCFVCECVCIWYVHVRVCECVICTLILGCLWISPQFSYSCKVHIRTHIIII